MVWKWSREGEEGEGGGGEQGEGWFSTSCRHRSQVRRSFPGSLTPAHTPEEHLTKGKKGGDFIEDERRYSGQNAVELFP